MSASIPKKLKIFIKSQTQVHRTVCGQKQMVFVRKAFATDAEKPKTHETARRWANPPGYVWDPVKECRVRALGEKKYEVVDRDNKPFEGLTIYNIEIRSEGGRAYKVQTKEGWCFDCREDCILDTIMESGVGRGGVMYGQFIWAKEGSQMKITRVGSALYQEAQKYMKRESKSKIKNKDLEYGGIYKNMRGEIDLYLGRDKDKKLKLTYLWNWRAKGAGGDFSTAWKREQRKDIKDYDAALKSAGGRKNTVFQHGYHSDNDPRVLSVKHQKTQAFVEKIGQLTKEEIEELIVEVNHWTIDQK